MKQQQQQQQKLEDSVYAPSFNCYSSDSTKTTTAIAKVIHEEVFHDFGDDFEFSLSDEDVSVKEINSQGFPVFNRDLLVNGEIKASNDEIDGSSVIASPLRRLFIDETDESSSYSSSEVDEFESPRSVSKCKKSSSTGSRSKRWIFRYLLRRSNSDGKEPMVLSSSKQLKQKQRNSGEVLKVQSPEQFYLRRRAENEAGKRRSYLPYRKDLVGLFAF
ncbi:hypothetical protein QVD17_04649 [Tagetes erecta]|uniref:Uncharacterized protein n=1 Tax=Tagetes erecta TaxID=13708 RepID=A0AAD8LD33_TARER|nr:hypothetical protein QVD17_04649 [Tagetes erecta]